MIEVKNLYHSYFKNGSYAIKDLNFYIKPGEIFGFLGPSGSGKSTTQNILIGLLPLQRGEILINGKDISESGKNLFNYIGVSFEKPNVYKKLSALENLQFYKSMFKVPTEDPMKLLKMVGLEKDAHKKAGEYSKGMLQRLVFARSMINNPKIWFLDEPTSGLDPTTTSVIKDIIKEKQKMGTTIFLTTHNMHIAEELCDRVAFITNGELRTMDSPRNLKLKYGEKLVTVEYREDKILKRETLSLTDEKQKLRINELILKASIETIHTQEATLEKIFIKVTGKELK
ncbi:fluoroquinolone transport system ATP-binding protein [Clostridium tetanomorphum]|uniref:ABC transporter ATP-binding protein n=1 Tax=Clostridium tetanomorphum TaxID=1553 RepID=A0A923ECS5_CLOTT|nr:ABC transporter ATP-binding protein [Clostridium tetanomorphum]KAJ49282.1 ABC transporter-like protein [Clostridium tetanomorphum DSM 665]KAJ53928.1 ABC transporter-like protein [Clostridium tetanomorphum DSM 665]MBC2398088.1 ABC transporter ATP-binding protein [Clostridium tetanomorphum]MBP1864655.1 fluoroquinolone transport system ATP-binding protein [Clostridium tetanomorphum]NRS84125.1 fluoroquinolone transport system ATP-binding protein [Clostridium tetanomorphum]